jgi:hypothetical protein
MSNEDRSQTRGYGLRIRGWPRDVVAAVALTVAAVALLGVALLSSEGRREASAVATSVDVGTR